MYWISDAFAVSNWRIGSSLIAIGLSWKLALVAVVIGNFITALVVTFNVSRTSLTKTYTEPFKGFDRS